MTNDFAQMFNEPTWDVIESIASAATSQEGFDEEAYLRANPDVAAAVDRHELPSGYSHYISIGLEEKRPLFSVNAGPRNRLVHIPHAATNLVRPVEAQVHVEAMLASTAGGILVVGWMDDVSAPLDQIRVMGPGWFYAFDASSVVRFRRSDVEAAVGSSRMYGFGFLAFAFLGTGLEVSGGCELVIETKGCGRSTVPFMPRQVDDTELRSIVLKYVAEAEFYGNRQIEVMRALDGPIGRQIIAQNLRITRDVVAGASVERFGRPAKSLRGSIVVCLYGKPEYLFLQNALFAGLPGFEDYELVYVSNSPEMAERLLKEAYAAQQIYGVPTTMVLLPGNAGFGAANNVAAAHARSNRLLIMNPDVFPRDQDWAKKHSETVENLPLSQTRIFGVPLYYDDGSLMHGGMYFESDLGVSLDAGQVTRRTMSRVEHYGKGAPAWATQFTKSRPVQAVTGAFISIDRSWYETLDGFTESYVFGHYEDADLCLKSIHKGTAPWIHDIRLWHLEGKGSLRLPVHEGGSLVNRWLFTRTWSELIDDGLYGPEPSSPMFQAATTTAAADLPAYVEPAVPEPGVLKSSSAGVEPDTVPQRDVALTMTKRMPRRLDRKVAT